MSYSTANGPENWGSVRLEGDDDLTVDGAYVRNVGMGIEGRPVDGGSTLGVSSAASKSSRRASAVSWSSGRATVVGTSGGNGKQRQVSTASAPPAGVSAGGDDYATGEGSASGQERDGHMKDGQLLTTMAILQTFHAHTLFQLSVLENLLAQQGLSQLSSSSATARPRDNVFQLTPKDILAFELGPLSGFDAKYLEWLVQEYAGNGVNVVVKRGWRDLLNALFGYS